MKIHQSFQNISVLP